MDATPTTAARQVRPRLGHGVGLRVPHYERALQGPLDVDWIEAISENFMRPGGRPLAVLERVRRDLPVVLHGVGLGVGSVAPLDRDYLARLRALADRIEPAWLSDHLCFGRVGVHHAHDLLPLPFSEEALALAVERIAAAQDALGRRILIENVSSYVAYNASTMTEWEFVAEVAARADCLLLVDLNNVVVSAANHGFEPATYLAGLPAERVWQFHLAGHDVRPNHRFDSHRGAVPDEVWSLYRDARARFGDVSTLIEWDEDIPSWEVLRAEAEKARGTGSDAHLLEMTGPVARGASFPESTATPGALAATQRLFWDVITYPTGATRFAEARGGEALAAVFAETPGFSRLERLELYADAYFWRLFGALLEMFPALERALGRDRFNDLVTDYLLALPSTEADLGRLGARLPGFVATHAIERALAGAAELAAVEWAFADLLHAADETPATSADLAAIPIDAWPSLRLAATALVRLVPCRHDVAAVRRDAAAPLTPSAAGVVLVWRRGFAAKLRAPARPEAAALAALVAGTDFAALCALAASPEQAAGWLQRWVADGLLARP
jgi:uncharacterized protein (UPF0276 family)